MLEAPWSGRNRAGRGRKSLRRHTGDAFDASPQSPADRRLTLDPWGRVAVTHAMVRTLVLMRHGLASGQAPDAHLLPEGEAQVRRLGRLLAREGWAPTQVVSSPYRRARETVTALLDELGATGPITTLHELVPESEPDEAIDALLPHSLESPRVLAVAHLPLLDRLLYALTNEMPGFSPGTFVELELDEPRRGRIVRRIVARELAE
jgi:phosphohistidine phosphatase